jgi:hypothetical protein
MGFHEMGPGQMGAMMKSRKGIYVNNDNNTWRNSMKTIARLGLVMAGMFVLTVAAFASDVTIPNTFVAGATASASEVNVNFAAVEAAIDDNDARLDAMAAGGVTSAYITDGTITSADIADSTITSADIAADTIVAADIATGAVTTTEILDGTIATADIANGAVTSAKINSSGLNADMLDGYHSTSFATVSHGHPTLPLAMGTIDADGTIIKAWNVTSCTWNATYSRYEIAITGYSYTLWYEATVVTVLGGGHFHTGVDGVSSKLLVYITNSAGANVQHRFSFVSWDIP